MRLGNEDMAVTDLETYLELRPNAADAILVSQRIGKPFYGLHDARADSKNTLTVR